ncbi:hypothetical protein [Streptomyces sp. DH24]|uniref:hypothetical protein n=1 Tax=Streptomyces sp. DH24 TaxID=3040123 RepID=UPI002442BD0F|nr:hypothetical protein [Streptomyces sp. DH24]MDG9717659.1 hypothetical protein [Streptomyces sp. DH24]
MPRRRYGSGIAAGILAIAVLTSCAASSERRDQVTEEVTRFETALQAGRNGRACAALAPSTRQELEQSARSRCERAMSEQQLPQAGAVRTVDVYGGQARVVLEHDTVFLARFPAGWKVTAAGCRPRADQPYQCEIKGG